MTARSLIVVGAGGHARACIDVLEREGSYAIVGLIGLLHEVGSRVGGQEVIGTDDDLAQLATTGAAAVIGIGQLISPRPRVQLFKKLAHLGFYLPAILSPLAYVSSRAEVGEGTIVMHGAMVGPGARIGKNCIINTGALVEHDSVIADHCHLATRAVLNGGAQVGSGSFVGSGSLVREGINIGSDCIVGMGLSVRHDLSDGTRFIGA